LPEVKTKTNIAELDIQIRRKHFGKEAKEIEEKDSGYELAGKTK